MKYESFFHIILMSYCNNIGLKANVHLCVVFDDYIYNHASFVCDLFNMDKEGKEKSSTPHEFIEIQASS